MVCQMPRLTIAHSGTRKERGLEAWNASDKYSEADYASYDIPWLRFITNIKCMKFIPISPAFSQNEPQWPKKLCPCSQRTEEDDNEVEMTQNL